MLAYALQLRDAGQDKEALSVVLNHVGYTQRRGFAGCSGLEAEITPPTSGRCTPRSRPCTPRGGSNDSSVACQLALLGVELCNQLADRSLAVKMWAQALDYCEKGEGLCDSAWKICCGGQWWKDARWACARCKCLFNTAEAIRATSKTEKDLNANELQEVLRRLNECEEIQQRWPSCVEQPESLLLCLAETRWRLGNHRVAEESCKKALAALGCHERLGPAGVHAVMLGLWISANIAFETGRYGEVAAAVHHSQSLHRDCPDEELKFRLGRVLIRLERLGRQAVLAQTDGTCAMASSCISSENVPVGSGVSAVRRQRSTREISSQTSETSVSPRGKSLTSPRITMSTAQVNSDFDALASSRAAPPASPRIKSCASASPRASSSISPRARSCEPASSRSTPSGQCSSTLKRFKDADVSPRVATPRVSPRIATRDSSVCPRTATPHVSPRCATLDANVPLRVATRDAGVSPRAISERLSRKAATAVANRHHTHSTRKMFSPTRSDRTGAATSLITSINMQRAAVEVEDPIAFTQDSETQASAKLVDEELDILDKFLANQEDEAISMFLSGGKAKTDVTDATFPAHPSDGDDDYEWQQFAAAISAVGPKKAPTMHKRSHARREYPPLPRQRSTSPPRQQMELSLRHPVTPPRRSPKRPSRPGRSLSPGVWGGVDSEASTEFPGLSHATSSSSLPHTSEFRTGSHGSETPLTALGIDLAHVHPRHGSRSSTPPPRVPSRPPPLQLSRSRSNTPPPQGQCRNVQLRSPIKQEAIERDRYPTSPALHTPDGPPLGLLEDLQDFLRTYEGGGAEPEPAPLQTPPSTMGRDLSHVQRNSTENLLHEVLEELCAQPVPYSACKKDFQAPQQMASLQQKTSQDLNEEFPLRCNMPAPDHSQIPYTVTAQSTPPRFKVVHGASPNDASETAESRSSRDAFYLKPQTPTCSLTEPVFCLPSHKEVSSFTSSMYAAGNSNTYDSMVAAATQRTCDDAVELSPEKQPPAGTLSEPVFCLSWNGMYSAVEPEVRDDVAGPCDLHPSLHGDDTVVTGEDDPVKLSPKFLELVASASQQLIKKQDVSSGSTPELPPIQSKQRTPLPESVAKVVADIVSPCQTECTLCQNAPTQPGKEWCAQCEVLQVVCPLCKRSLSFGEMHVHLLSCRPGAGAADCRAIRSSAVHDDIAPEAHPVAQGCELASRSRDSTTRQSLPRAVGQPQRASSAYSHSQKTPPNREGVIKIVHVPSLRAVAQSKRAPNACSEKDVPNDDGAVKAHNVVHGRNALPSYLREQLSPDPSGEQLQPVVPLPPAFPKKDSKLKSTRPSAPKGRPPALISPTSLHMNSRTGSPSRSQRTTMSPPKSRTSEEQTKEDVSKHSASQAPTPVPIPMRPPPPCNDIAEYDAEYGVLSPSRQAQLPPGVARWRPAGGPEKFPEQAVDPPPVVEVLLSRLKAAAAAAAEDSTKPHGSLAWAYRGVRSQVNPPHLVRGIFIPKGSQRSSPRNAGTVSQVTTPR